MFELLDKLRKKPDRTRKSIALGISIGITAIIFAIWLFNLIWGITHAPTNGTPGVIDSLVSGISTGVQSVQSTFATSSINQ